MDTRGLLNGKHDCACGRDHTCDVRYVEIGDGVLSRLLDVCRDFSRIHIVSDQNTDRLAGDEVRARLGDKHASSTLFGKAVVIPDEAAIARIESDMADGVDFIIGIGSGVINDLCKHVSFVHGLRYAIVATAPSMDGYASVGAALILGGMKVTLNARVPYAILAESRVLATAPAEMLQSGYGDIVGKYSCLNDWRLASLLRGEYFCQSVYDNVMEVVKNTENTAKSILSRNKDAVCRLMEGLVTVGIMMSYVGNSRPASGSEHHLSHFFEITGILNGTPYYPHGIDVLYASVITAKLREALLSLTPPFEAYQANRTAWEREMRRVYTSAADGVIALQDKVGLYGEIDNRALESQWRDVCRVLSDAPSAAAMEGFVDSIGLNMADFHAFYGEKVLSDALRYAKDLKDRFTVLWLAYALGIGYPA